MPPFAGNPRAFAAVQRSLAGERPPHAYLFAGPDGVGKRTLAVWLAQALNCEPDVVQAPSPEVPCGECRACTRIAAGIHSDVQTISYDTADDGRVLTFVSVEQVREIQRSVALAPYEGRTRVVIIDPADGMNDAAQNAFLKTLEEPPSYATFVLITTHEEGMLPTIRSRCRLVEFRLLPAMDVEAALTAAGVEPVRASLLARLSGGRIGWAITAVGDPSLLERRADRLEQARAIPEMSIAERMRLAEKLSDDFKRDREPVFALLAAWLAWWRDLLLVQAGAEDGVANSDLLPQLRQAADRHTQKDAIRFVRALLMADEQLHANVQSKIALEALLIQAPLRSEASAATL